MSDHEALESSGWYQFEQDREHFTCKAMYTQSRWQELPCYGHDCCNKVTQYAFKKPRAPLDGPVNIWWRGKLREIMAMLLPFLSYGWWGNYITWRWWWWQLVMTVISWLRDIVKTVLTVYDISSNCCYFALGYTSINTCDGVTPHYGNKECYPCKVTQSLVV